MPDRAEWLETLPLLTESQRHELRSVFRRALIESPMPTALTDLQGTLLGANEQFAQLLGLHEAELAGRPMFQYVHEDDRASIQAAVSRLRHGGEEVIRNEARFVRADGRLVWIRGHAALVDGPAGDGTSYMVGIVQDITSEKYAQQQARTLIEIGTGIAAGDPIEETAGRLAELAMARWMEVGVTLTLADPARRVLTPVQHRLMPTGLYEAFGEIPIAPTGPSCGVAAWSNEPVAMANMFTDPRTVSLRAMLAEFGIAASWSQPLRDPEGHVIGTLGLYHSRPSEPTDEDWQTLSDVAGVAAIAILTHNRRRANREERQRLRTDSRTGLPNELALLDVVDTTVASGDPVSIVVVALRGPAAVRNEKHLRDRTLSTMAERIRQLAGIVAVGVSGLGSLIVVARGEWSTHEVELLQRVLARALILDEMSILPQVSIGAASTDGDLTLSAADLLAQAKGVVPPQQGVAVALPRLGERIEPELTADVSRALQQGEFVVHYQPQVDLTNGELLGSEALVRWQHPTRGLLPPAAFLPAVEAIGAGSELAFAVARMVSAEESR
ncbi:MAG TPA: PAS domain S-box protein, partial [Mycobacteriales bacterium]|nr:PAS domain S-box protein [Mycobacteriales bacterium]